MSTVTELKLLTLLNVSAIKRPRDLDQPGGFRGSPPISRSTRTARREPQPGPSNKRRKGVVWGGELGPSGSTFGQKAAAKQLKQDTGSSGDLQSALLPDVDEIEADVSEEDEMEASDG